ncbi:MAG TPA: hypothetical protein VGM65_07110 [Candidatus Udaeobacter sp.]|jgi:hypothetical protein
MRTISISFDTTFLLVPHVFALNCCAHIVSQPVNPQHSPAEPTSDLQPEIGHALLIDVVGYPKLLANDRAIAGLQKLLSIPYYGALAESIPLTPALLRNNPRFKTLC